MCVCDAGTAGSGLIPQELTAVHTRLLTPVCWCVLQVFDAHGSFLSYINTSADPLYGPQGLAITDQGNVVVGDSGNHCFKIYRYLQ